MHSAYQFTHWALCLLNTRKMIDVGCLAQSYLACGIPRHKNWCASASLHSFIGTWNEVQLSKILQQMPLTCFTFPELLNVEILVTFFTDFARAHMFLAAFYLCIGVLDLVDFFQHLTAQTDSTSESRFLDHPKPSLCR